MENQRKLSPTTVNFLFFFGLILAGSVFYTTVTDVLDGSTRLPSKFTHEDNIFLSSSPLTFYLTIFIRLIGGTFMGALAILLKLRSS
ncbi:MAG: hypothetical protein ACOY4U_11280 [Pseudomonadota bacterium]